MGSTPKPALEIQRVLGRTAICMDLGNVGVGQGQLADVGIDGGPKPRCASLMPENSIIAPHTNKQGKTSTQWFFHFLVQNVFIGSL